MKASILAARANLCNVVFATAGARSSPGFMAKRAEPAAHSIRNGFGIPAFANSQITLTAIPTTIHDHHGFFLWNCKLCYRAVKLKIATREIASVYEGFWWAVQGSNLRPPACKA